jgi:large subunit ribosomal protein L24
MLKIKKGDTVRITTGKDKGKEGKVLEIDRKNDRVVVEGLNLIKKHAKPSAAEQKGGIISREAPLHISNVALVVDGEITKVGFKVTDGAMVRISKKTGKVID